MQELVVDDEKACSDMLWGIVLGTFPHASASSSAAESSVIAFLQATFNLNAIIIATDFEIFYHKSFVASPNHLV